MPSPRADGFPDAIGTGDADAAMRNAGLGLGAVCAAGRGLGVLARGDGSSGEAAGEFDSRGNAATLACASAFACALAPVGDGGGRANGTVEIG